jgi:hypothetical protein
MGNVEIDAGYFYDGITNRPLIKAKIDTVFSKDGSPERLKMLLTDKDGEDYSIKAEAVKKAVLPFQSPDHKSISLLHETLGKYRMGDLTGYGILEYLIRKD